MCVVTLYRPTITHHVLKSHIFVVSTRRCSFRGSMKSTYTCIFIRKGEINICLVSGYRNIGLNPVSARRG